jgi:hypothetical protein
MYILLNGSTGRGLFIMFISVSRPITALLLSTILLVSSLLLYRSCSKSKFKSGPTIAQQVEEAKKDLSSSKKEARTAEFKLFHRTRLKDLPAIKVGSVITSETLELLQVRERDALDAVCKLDIALEKAEVVIRLEDTQIAQLEYQVTTTEHKVIIWKMIAGVIVIIAIVIII